MRKNSRRLACACRIKTLDLLWQAFLEQFTHFAIPALHIIIVMADADEDVIPRTGPSAEDIDLSDETQDFRFLAALS